MENRISVCEIKKKFERLNSDGNLVGKDDQQSSLSGGISVLKKEDLGPAKCHVKRSNAFRSDKTIAELKGEPWIGIELGEKARAVLRSPLPPGPPPKKPPRTFKHPLPQLYYEPPVYSQPFKEYPLKAISQPQTLHYMSTPIPEVKDVKPNLSNIEVEFLRESKSVSTSRLSSSSEDNIGCWNAGIKGFKKKGISEPSSTNNLESKSWTEEWPRFCMSSD